MDVFDYRRENYGSIKSITVKLMLLSLGDIHTREMREDDCSREGMS